MRVWGCGGCIVSSLSVAVVVSHPDVFPAEESRLRKKFFQDKFNRVGLGRKQQVQRQQQQQTGPVKVRTLHVVGMQNRNVHIHVDTRARACAHTPTGLASGCGCARQRGGSAHFHPRLLPPAAAVSVCCTHLAYGCFLFFFRCFEAILAAATCPCSQSYRCVASGPGRRAVPSSAPLASIGALQQRRRQLQQQEELKRRSQSRARGRGQTAGVWYEA